MDVRIHHLYLSPGHNYFGHHGQPAGENPIVDVPSVMCRAGRGLEGDRFFDYKENYAGQITFFAWEIIEAARARFNVPQLSPAAFRRNAIVSGVELPSLIGRRFRIGEVEFEGAVESKPCYWMDQAVAPGAEEWLRGNGGLRARILCDGPLQVGPAKLEIIADVTVSTALSKA